MVLSIWARSRQCCACGLLILGTLSTMLCMWIIPLLSNVYLGLHRSVEPEDDADDDWVFRPMIYCFQELLGYVSQVKTLKLHMDGDVSSTNYMIIFW